MYAVSVALISACSSPNSPGPPTGPGGPPPVQIGAPVLVGAGDIANCETPGDEATARLLDLYPDATVFTAGDNVYYHGNASEFRDCYDPTWGRHKGRTRPAPGNHDYETPGASGYFDYFGGNAGPRGLGYYTFDVGSWRIYSLNSEPSLAGVGSSQMAWLKGELASRPANCSIAIWHHPVFTSGPNGPNPYMREILRVLYDNNVDIVLNGHDHLYERFAPQDPDGRVDFNRGIRQFTVGTGGTSLYQNVTVAANSERIASVWGILRLVLNPGEYEWEFVPVGETGFRDSGTGKCH